MEDRLFRSIDDMLQPDTLGLIGGLSIRSVQRVPLQLVEAYSGSTFYRIETNGRDGPNYILKCMPYSMVGTNKNLHPSVSLWRHGLLQKLPPEVDHAGLAYARDGEGYALLMRDVHEDLIPGDKILQRDDNEFLLNSMAALHAAFWDDRQLVDSLLDIYRPCHLYPRIARQAIPDTEGWMYLKKFVAPEITSMVLRLLENPAALCDALACHPLTLVHNDLWWANLGIHRRSPKRVIVLDWDFATVAPPAVDLAFYLGENALLLPSSKEESILFYKSRLSAHLGAQFNEHQWSAQLNLSLLGCFLRRGKWLLLDLFRAVEDKQKERLAEELDWWIKAVRLGLQRL